MLCPTPSVLTLVVVKARGSAGCFWIEVQQSPMAALSTQSVPSAWGEGGQARVEMWLSDPELLHSCHPHGTSPKALESPPHGG